MMRKRRRTGAEKKLPASTRTYTICFLSILSIIIFAAAFGFAIFSSGNTYKFIAAFGTIIMIISLGCCFIGIREFKDSQRKLFPRLSALFLSVLSFALWISLYIIGYVNQ